MHSLDSTHEIDTHEVVEPAILYFGTPVVLVSTLNEDGSANLSPMSSAWWIRRTCVLGFDSTSKTVENMHRARECVLNLPSAELAAMVDRLACTTGSDPLPAHKVARGYRHEPNKFGTAGFTPASSELVKPPRIQECPVQLEAVVEDIRPFTRGGPRSPALVETRIVRVHIAKSILMAGEKNRIDPVKWRPLIMNFCRFFGLGPELYPSRLAEIPESMYAPQGVAARLQEILNDRLR